MARGVNTIKAYQEFLKKHPDSEFSEEAKAKLEPLAYQKAVDTDTLQGYAAYLIQYPQGAHKDESRARISRESSLHGFEKENIRILKSVRDGFSGNLISEFNQAT
jgi:hypothetical protein